MNKAANVIHILSFVSVICFNSIYPSLVVTGLLKVPRGGPLSRESMANTMGPLEIAANVGVSPCISTRPRISNSNLITSLDDHSLLRPTYLPGITPATSSLFTVSLFILLHAGILSWHVIDSLLARFNRMYTVSEMG